MSATFTREEIEGAALLIVVDGAGAYRWSSNGERGPAAVAAWLRDASNDLMLTAIESTSDPAIQAALIAGWESDTKNALADLVAKVITGLRKRDVAYAIIGRAFGVSRQAAWERFSRVVDSPIVPAEVGRG